METQFGDLFEILTRLIESNCVLNVKMDCTFYIEAQAFMDLLNRVRKNHFEPFRTIVQEKMGTKETNTDSRKQKKFENVAVFEILPMESHKDGSKVLYGVHLGMKIEIEGGKSVFFRAPKI